MFQFQLLVAIFCLKGLYGAQTVNLTELDSTWVVSGYQTKLLSPVTILSEANYFVHFMVTFENGTNQADTDFVITDSRNTTINSKTLNPAEFSNFLGTITIVDKSPIGSYSLSFRLVILNDSSSPILLSANRIFTIIPNDNKLHRYSTPDSGKDGTFVIYTAMPSLYASPTISLKPTYQVKAGCEHLLYQGGFPAAAGLNRYLLHNFNSANTGPASSLSFIPSYSATIYVPPNCPISIDAADYSKDYSGKRNMLMNVVPRNGFVMSRDYPNNMLGNGNGGMNVNVQYALNSSVFGNQSVNFNILVDQFSDGQTGTPQLELSFDNQVGYILNKTTTGFSQNRNAASFRVEFTTSNSIGANFLLHFTTSISSTTDSPTTTITTTNSPTTTTTSTTTLATTTTTTSTSKTTTTTTSLSTSTSTSTSTTTTTTSTATTTTTTTTTSRSTSTTTNSPITTTKSVQNVSLLFVFVLALFCCLKA